MLNDFFTRAIVAGIGIAITAGPLGCFVVWRRMAYFGDTMAHAALLGVVIGVLTGIDPLFGVFALSVALAMLLLALDRMTKLASDTLLGILSHGALAAGIVLYAVTSKASVDLLGLLLGDILAVSRTDVLVVWATAAAVVAALAAIWRPMLAATVDVELARAEGMATARAGTVFMILLAGFIAIAIKLVGVLLITALLVIPAAAARRLSGSPESMAIAAALIGAAAVVGGLFASFAIDSPSGPSIVVAALIIFTGAVCTAAIGSTIRARIGRRRDLA